MAVGHIGVPFFDQMTDHLDHVGDEVGCARLMIRRQRAKRGNIILKIRNRIVAKLVNANVFVACPIDDFVINISDMAVLR